MPHKASLIEFHRSSGARVHILLAEDFAPWRSYVRSFVERETEWEIIFETRDGLEAVQKTFELHPDVVLMDLSLPELNGIEATRRICQLSPHCRVMILSENADEDLRDAALEAGAVAYLLKTEMTTELLPALRAALRTRR